jgi:hypothetical protein
MTSHKANLDFCSECFDIEINGLLNISKVYFDDIDLTIFKCLSSKLSIELINKITSLIKHSEYECHCGNKLCEVHYNRYLHNNRMCGACCWADIT